MVESLSTREELREAISEIVETIKISDCREFKGILNPPPGCRIVLDAVVNLLQGCTSLSKLMKQEFFPKTHFTQLRNCFPVVQILKPSFNNSLTRSTKAKYLIVILKGSDL